MKFPAMEHIPDLVLSITISFCLKFTGNEDILSGHLVTTYLRLCATSKNMQRLAIAQWDLLEQQIQYHMSMSHERMNSKEAIKKFALTRRDISKLTPLGTSSSIADRIRAEVFRGSKSNYAVGEIWKSAIEKHGSYIAVIAMTCSKKRKLQLLQEKKVLRYEALQKKLLTSGVSMSFAQKQVECQRYLDSNITTIDNAVDAAVIAWRLVRHIS